jgi:UDP-N-acetylglucosamine--N-acetylmuramyl-(pentapeptide) pyrophosphoryl-undecaprenol N-acetylglucosamine transferase
VAARAAAAARALLQALAVIRRRRPALVVGLGGFVAGPGGVAAWLLRRPLLIHEQNAIAGFTNRCLARLARRVLTAFPGSFRPAVGAQVVGNPVRTEIAELPPPPQRFAQRGPDAPAGARRQPGCGAPECDGAVRARALAATLSSRCSTSPVSAGSRRRSATTPKPAVSARLQPFIEDMAAAYGWADLVICRAGALTCLGAGGRRRGCDPGAVSGRDRRSPDPQRRLSGGRRRGR